jgi:hypothetical protein
MHLFFSHKFMVVGLFALTSTTARPNRYKLNLVTLKNCSQALEPLPLDASMADWLMMFFSDEHPVLAQRAGTSGILERFRRHRIHRSGEDNIKNVERMTYHIGGVL